MGKNGVKRKAKSNHEPTVTPENHQNSGTGMRPSFHQNQVSKQNNHPTRKGKHSFKRIAVDPTKQYHTPESRESWGHNVKGKKFKKEKGKKKRCPNAGHRIDGSVNSIKFN